MGRLRDFTAIHHFFSDQEIDELQAAVDARREAREEAPKADITATTSGRVVGSERE